MGSNTASYAGSRRGASGLDELLVRAVSDSGAHIGALYLLDEDGQVLRMNTAMGFPAAIAKAWARVRLTVPMPVAAAARERRLVWTADQEDLARQFPGAALALPYNFAVATAPIVCGESARGTLLLVSPASNAPGPEPRLLGLMERTCRDMADLLEQADRLGRPVRPRPRPRILAPYRSRQDDPAVSPEAAMAALECLNGLPEGYCALDVDGRVTFLSAPASGLLDTTAAAMLGKRPWEVLPWLADPPHEDSYRSAILGHQVTFFTAERPDGQWLAFQLFPAPSGLSVRITPSTMARDPGHVLPDPVVGRQVGGAALYDMLQLAASLSQAATVQDVIDLVADQVMPVFDVKGLAILTAEGGRLRVAATRGYSPASVAEMRRRTPCAPHAPELPIITGEPAFFANERELLDAYPDAGRYGGMSAWALLPLLSSGGPIGTLVLAYGRPHRFTQDERTTLTTLAGLMAQALERARLYDAKHRLAQTLQSSLLPRALPVIPGLEVAARYLPATQGIDIGGDFYDLIHLGDGQAAAVIGDVQGHDTTAAALMGQVRTAIHAHATSGASAGEVLTHTNRLLIDLAPNRFTSCLYISLDLRDHTACVASAGHLPPLLRRPGATTEVVESTPGLLLGIDPAADYPTSELYVPPGSVLALYTDGLIEAPGVDLGDAIDGLAGQLTRHGQLPLARLADRLIDPAESVGHRSDDIAVLLLSPVHLSP
ncbi:SpoIIE family protein phosphatase [Nonomuraea sp. SBT364]|uniref:SpoIIE family protein phosphatase n=1 Tax=Nonomuraea sp. SBT364 TaxID=1580530 RepID=UPI00066B122A|nr:SpoIIE family protein phosphatase [Nonomuraea sp. SBT364]